MSRFTDPLESTRKARRKVVESVENVTSEVAKHLPTPSMPELDPLKPIDAFFDGMKSMVEVQRSVTKKAVGQPAALVRGAAENVSRLQERGKERVDEVVAGVLGRKSEAGDASVLKVAPTSAPAEAVKVPEPAQPEESVVATKTGEEDAVDTVEAVDSVDVEEAVDTVEAVEAVDTVEAVEAVESVDEPVASVEELTTAVAEETAGATSPDEAAEAVAHESDVSVAEAVALTPQLAGESEASSAEESGEPEVPAAFAAPKKRNYRLMNSNQLRKACERRGIDSEGTLDELRVRLREADEADETDEAKETVEA